MRLLAVAYYHLTKRTFFARRANYSHFNTSARFDRLYTLDADPFSVERSHYEYLKAKDLLTVLTSQHYSNVLDAGCGTGRMTKKLSAFADRIVGIDFSGEAIRLAHTYCSDLPHATFELSDLRDFASAMTYDLIVCSEVLYYLTGPDLTRAIASLKNAASERAELVVITRLDHEATRAELEREFILELQIDRANVVRPYTISRYRAC
jgi:2-polyprenyl-3-methyl-5-hydroxy-6-metoxy-1,4-benzoquinol methylase